MTDKTFWTKHFNRHFTEEDIQTANKQINNCSTTLIIKEMQINNHDEKLIQPHQNS